MPCWDPTLIVSFCTRCHGRPISTNDGDLVSRVNFGRSARRLLGSLSTLSTALLLGKESRDPGAVDKVAGAPKCSKEKEVKEDAMKYISLVVGTSIDQGAAYICGSKKLASGSTMLTVSLKACRV